LPCRVTGSKKAKKAKRSKKRRKKQLKKADRLYYDAEASEGATLLW
jgi:hypothetical protein